MRWPSVLAGFAALAARGTNVTGGPLDGLPLDRDVTTSVGALDPSVILCDNLAVAGPDDRGTKIFEAPSSTPSPSPSPSPSSAPFSIDQLVAAGEPCRVLP
jgi:hypothetical protein